MRVLFPTIQPPRIRRHGTAIACTPFESIVASSRLRSNGAVETECHINHRPWSPRSVSMTRPDYEDVSAKLILDNRKRRARSCLFKPTFWQLFSIISPAVLSMTSTVVKVPAVMRDNVANYDQLLMNARNEGERRNRPSSHGPRERGPDLTPSPTVPAGRGRHF